MAKKLLQNSLIVAFTLILNDTAFSQTTYWEQMVIENLPTYINDINNHLFPILTQIDKSTIGKVKVQIDSSTTEYTANSDSKERTITFSNNLIKSIVRFSVAQLIDFDSTDFNRKRFAGFYTSVYPYLNNAIVPETAAELTVKQIDLLKQIANTHEFRWIVEQKFMFVYLHELHHQLQDYSEKSKQINAKNISQQEKDSLLFLLEIEADNFATDKLAKMDIDPTECEDVLSFFSLIREKRFTTVRQITKRQLNFFEFCYKGFGCDTIDDALCQKIKNKYFGFIRLDHHYTRLLNPDSLKTMRKEAVIDFNVHSIYNLGDFYFKGTSEHISNLDSAIYFYKLAANLKATGNNLFGATSKEQLIGIIEYCQVMTGKIFELKLQDKSNAINYFEQAMVTSVFLPREYYKKILQRLRKV